MRATTLHIVEDGEVQNLNVFLRGNVDRKGPLVERRFLEVLQPAPAQPFKDGSGRRELAEAIASPRNPLTARAMKEIDRVGVCADVSWPPCVSQPSFSAAFWL